VRSLSSSYGSEPDEGTRRRLGSFLTLTAFHGNVITSAMFVTAMAANPLAVQLAGAAGVSISWGKWALAALLPGLVSLLLVPLVVYKLQRPEVTRTPEAPHEARRKLTEMGPMSRAEKTMLAERFPADASRTVTGPDECSAAARHTAHSWHRFGARTRQSLPGAPVLKCGEVVLRGRPQMGVHLLHVGGGQPAQRLVEARDVGLLDRHAHLVRTAVRCWASAAAIRSKTTASYSAANAV
jgi:hypothetical protein